MMPHCFRWGLFRPRGSSFTVHPRHRRCEYSVLTRHATKVFRSRGSYRRLINDRITPVLAGIAGASFVLSCSINCDPASATSSAPVITVQTRRITDDYELGEALGAGSFATVRRAICRKTGKQVAIKEIPVSRQSAHAVREEVSILQRVSMHRCVAMFEAVYEEADRFFIGVPCVHAAGAHLVLQVRYPPSVRSQ